MKYYATIDAEGRRTATYLPDHPNIPEDAFEIDEDTFQEWVNNRHTRKWDGEKLVKCDPPPAPKPRPLAEIVAERIERDPALKAIVDAVAGKIDEPPEQMLARVKAAAAR